MDNPQIYDCFLFFNELDLLEIRLNELDPYVDYFVICESPVTHVSQPKPLYYKENRARFGQFEPKIIHLIYEDWRLFYLQKIGNAAGRFLHTWKHSFRRSIEKAQRNFLLTGLEACRDDDIVLLSDIDEIPKGSKIPIALDILTKQPLVCFVGNHFCYYLNGIRRLQDGSDFQWRGTVCFKYKCIREGLDFHDARIKRLDISEQSSALIKDSMWHFTYLGNPETIRDKLISWIHAYDIGTTVLGKQQDDLTWLKSCIDNGIYAFRFDREDRVDYIKLDDTFPEHILKHKYRFKHLIR